MREAFLLELWRPSVSHLILLVTESNPSYSAQACYFNICADGFQAFREVQFGFLPPLGPIREESADPEKSVSSVRPLGQEFIKPLLSNTLRCFD
jgi:hypothetical protein